MTEKKRSGYEILLMLLAVAAMLVFMPWMSAWCLMRVWEWYRPEFVAPLTLKSALGMVMLSYFMAGRFHRHKATKEDKDKVWSLMVQAVLTPWMFLAGAWLVKAIWL